MFKDFIQKIFSPRKANNQSDETKGSKKMKLDITKIDPITDLAIAEQPLVEEKKIIKEVYFSDAKSKQSYDSSFTLGTKEENNEFVLSVNDLQSEANDFTNEKIDELKKFIEEKVHEMTVSLRNELTKCFEILNEKIDKLENKEKKRSNLRAVRIKTSSKNVSKEETLINENLLQKQKEIQPKEEESVLEIEDDQSENNNEEVMNDNHGDEEILDNDFTEVEEIKEEINCSEKVNQSNEIKEESETEILKGLFLSAIKKETEKKKC